MEFHRFPIHKTHLCEQNLPINNWRFFEQCDEESEVVIGNLCLGGHGGVAGTQSGIKAMRPPFFFSVELWS